MGFSGIKISREIGMPTGVYIRKPKGFVDKSAGPDACWPWTGCLNQDGYGETWFNGRQIGAHRWSYEQECGPVPEGLHLSHLCRNPTCVNPKHLEPLSPRESVRRGKSTILTIEQVREIKAAGVNRVRGDGLMVARAYGVCGGTISDIWCGKTWKEVRPPA